jgi:hypothetical protein
VAIDNDTYVDDYYDTYGQTTAEPLADSVQFNASTIPGPDGCGNGPVITGPLSQPPESPRDVMG